MKEIIDFLMKFVAKPGIPSGGFWSWDQVIRAESTHFFFSACLGWLAFSLTLTIFSSRSSTWDDRSIFRFSLLFGIASSLTMHIIIDGFTAIA
jgi:hypothetical protein